jgi:1-acyl-sn-glycerol-3-phosphate acyltransferase
VARPLRVLRLFALVAVLMGGVGIALVVPFVGPAGRATVMRGWFRAVVRSTGIRLVVDGSITAGGVGTLVTANHVSWLDIPVVLSMQPMRVLAKTDVRGWPVIGLLAARGGSIFIDRERLRRLPGTVAEIAAALRAGDSVLVFPEGSTWCGRTRGRFYPATLQAAIDAGAPVRPVSLRYQLHDGTATTVAAFVGDDSLLASVWRIVGTRGLTAELTAAAPVAARGRQRRELATEVSSAVKVRPLGAAAAPYDRSHAG